jgi:hypothetical protein
MKKLLLLLAFFSTLQFTTPLKEGIKGQVFWLSGDQMPGPGKKNSPQLGVVREILIYKKITVDEVVRKDQFVEITDAEPVATLRSNADGTFKVKLPPGEYSVFSREPNGLFANIIDQNGCINCVTVKPKTFAWVVITIDYEAVY